MGSRKGTLHTLGVSLFRRLTGTYPEHFRRQYAAEIFEVLLQRLEGKLTPQAGQLCQPSFSENPGRSSSLSSRSTGTSDRGKRRGVWRRKEDFYHEINTVYLKRRLKRTGRVVLLLAALIPLYYGCIYAHARIQIARRSNWECFRLWRMQCTALVPMSSRGPAW